jgi:hypothetical protein
MLHRNNIQDYGNGWNERCRVWKLIWLQRHDGLWDLTDDFTTVCLPDPPSLAIRDLTFPVESKCAIRL